MPGIYRNFELKMRLCQFAFDHLIGDILKREFTLLGLCFSDVYLSSRNYDYKEETYTLCCEFENYNDTKGHLCVCIRTLNIVLAVEYTSRVGRMRKFTYKNKIYLEFNDNNNDEKVIFTDLMLEGDISFESDLYNWYVKFKNIGNSFDIKLICLNLSNISNLKFSLDKMRLNAIYKDGSELNTTMMFKESTKSSQAFEEIPCGELDLNKRGRRCGEWFKVWELRGGSRTKWAYMEQKEKNETRNNYKWWDLFKVKYDDRALEKWESMSNENQEKYEKKYKELHKKYAKSSGGVNLKKRKHTSPDTNPLQYCFVKYNNKSSSKRLILSIVQFPITGQFCSVRPYNTQDKDKYEKMPISNIYFIKRPRTALDKVSMPFRFEDGYYTIPAESVVDLCAESDKINDEKCRGTFDFDGSLQIST